MSLWQSDQVLSPIPLRYGGHSSWKQEAVPLWQGVYSEVNTGRSLRRHEAPGPELRWWIQCLYPCLWSDWLRKDVHYARAKEWSRSQRQVCEYYMAAVLLKSAFEITFQDCFHCPLVCWSVLQLGFAVLWIDACGSRKLIISLLRTCHRHWLEIFYWNKTPGNIETYCCCFTNSERWLVGAHCLQILMMSIPPVVMSGLTGRL